MNLFKSHRRSKTSARIICALFIAVIAFCLRIQLVDNYYPFSFEPDSEPCVEVTRSFYFFFKSPSTENFPQKLSHYPNYSDGDFIASALVANVVRPLCKAGIITTPLADSDNSLVIFSMRWSGVMFDALAAAIAFLIFELLTGSLLISLTVTLLYYLLNTQTLNIDLIRIDHFGLLTANLLVLSAVLPFKWPGKRRYYLLAGIAVGLVTGTKLNFPFYLLPLAFAMCYFIYAKKISLKNLLLLTISFIITTAFMYQRWLMYPENIIENLIFTLNNGKAWTGFWGNDKYGFYLWNEFFNHGYSLGTALVLILGYTSFATIFYTGLLKRDALKLTLVITFVVQSVALMLSPKIGRYGIIMPLWMGIFLAYGACFILQYLNSKPKRVLWQIAFGLLLLPGACYALKDYAELKEKSIQRAESIRQTRIDSYQWLLKNMEPGSVCAIQHPRSGNLPVFELPYVGDESFLTCPFLYRDQVTKFYPPNIDSLKKATNYIITSDKETNYTFDVLSNYHVDSSLLNAWRTFYASLDTLFPHYDFSSRYDNYGVKSIHLYKLKDSIRTPIPQIIDCRNSINEQGLLSWKLKGVEPNAEYQYQVQIAEDSSFKWLVLGSRDGFESRYRSAADPTTFFDPKQSYIPPQIMEAILAGKFKSVLHDTNLNEFSVQQRLQKFFWRVLACMVDSNLSLSGSLAVLMKNGDDKMVGSVISSLYNDPANVLDCNAQDYIKYSDLRIDSNAMANLHSVQYTFSAPAQLKKGTRYFWRIRLRNQYTVTSRWSQVRTLTL